MNARSILITRAQFNRIITPMEAYGRTRVRRSYEFGRLASSIVEGQAHIAGGRVSQIPASLLTRFVIKEKSRSALATWPCFPIDDRVGKLCTKPSANDTIVIDDRKLGDSKRFHLLSLLRQYGSHRLKRHDCQQEDCDNVRREDQSQTSLQNRDAFTLGVLHGIALLELDLKTS